MSAHGPVLVVALALTLACSDEPTSAPPVGPEAPPARASFTISGRILGPVQSDDNSDIELTLRETNGVGASLNFVRLTCNNRASQQWGADSFVAETGNNRVEANETVVFVRHYVCPTSGRPQEILADLTDDNGFHHEVVAAPFHPDWPGV